MVSKRNLGVAVVLFAACTTTGAARRAATQAAILGLRSTTLLAFYIFGRNVVALASMARISRRRLLWYAASAWSFSEVLFFFYIKEYQRRLDSQSTRRWQAVKVHSTAEKRMKSMERYLLSIVQAFKGANNSRKIPTQTTELVNGRMRFTSADTLQMKSMRRTPSTPNTGNLLHQPKHEDSVGDLLKLWEGQDDMCDDELQRLKLLDLASWFHGPGRGESDEISTWMQRGNIEQWVAHYWFRGATPEDLENKPERQELDLLVNTLLASINLTELAPGFNPGVRCYRLCSDPLPACHRPLFVYLGTSVFCPFAAAFFMRSFGFHQERVGGLSYWKRDAPRDRQGEDWFGSDPLIFAHGLGVGLIPYLLFIKRMSDRHCGDFYVPEFPFLAMAPWESVPSAREVVAQLQDMLMANGHTAGHFMGHSFGTLIVGWVMKMSPSTMLHQTLLEPASCLIMKCEAITRVFQGLVRTRCYHLLIHYFGFRELFTANLLSRNVFWEQSTVWPEDFHVPTLVQLAGEDHIVQSLFVRRMLENERASRKERRQSRRNSGLNSSSMGNLKTNFTHQNNDYLEFLWCEGFLHGEILARPRSQDKLFAKIRQMCQGKGTERNSSKV